MIDTVSLIACSAVYSSNTKAERISSDLLAAMFTPCPDLQNDMAKFASLYRSEG